MNKEHIDLKHLLAVKAIFKTNHLTKAAELLCLSQPALSRRISTLEHKLGLNIFNRVGKKLIPTTAGKKLIELADQVLPIYQHTQNDLQLLKQGHNEPIRIATACFTCYHWLPDVIKQLKDGIQIDIVSEATENPNQALIDGLID
ncbi:MAG: LysR family transcriptional regulator, partial [Marinicella sp.]